MGMIPKRDLIAEVSERVGVSRAIGKMFFEALQMTVVEHMSNLETVRIMRGLELTGVEVPEHKGLNPRTGETITVPTKIFPKAKFGLGFKAMLNGK